MHSIAPLGPVYQAGTLSGNPVAMAAGLATLKLVQQPGFHDRLSQQTAKLANGLKQKADAAGIPMSINYVGGMFGFFFTEEDNIEFLNRSPNVIRNVLKSFITACWIVGSIWHLLHLKRALSLPHMAMMKLKLLWQQQNWFWRAYK